MACPAHINVQGYVALISQGKYKEAVELIYRSLPLPGVLGRAMARVATHEVAHYLNQAGEHSGEGYMMERLGPAHLLAGDRRFFRLAPPRPRN